MTVPEWGLLKIVLALAQQFLNASQELLVENLLGFQEQRSWQR